MKQIEQCIRDLNTVYIDPAIGYPTDKYLEVLGKLKEFAEIEAQQPPQKTVITFTEQNGLRIEKPYSTQFTVNQRFILAVTLRICALGFFGLLVLGTILR